MHLHPENRSVKAMNFEIFIFLKERLLIFVANSKLISNRVIPVFLLSR